MDFKEFLLLEDAGMIPRSEDDRRPGDQKRPKRHRTANIIASAARAIKGLYTHARDQRKRTQAGTVVPITASTNITDPTLKRICELVSTKDTMGRTPVAKERARLAQKAIKLAPKRQGTLAGDTAYGAKI